MGVLIGKMGDVEQNFINVKHKMKNLEKSKEHIYIVDKFVNDFQKERKRDDDCG
jgi:quercetin dioxygenase-like cupin family protein